ncbi:inositol monophosphatase family protein [Haloparvum sp. AD34]
MDISPETLADVAAEAARAGGDFLASEFRSGHVNGEYGVDDVKAEADVAAERRVLDVVDEAFPSHATHGEESGYRGDSDYVWLVDPLDGTNNFADDFPSFATAVCCHYEDDPVAAAIYEPLPDTMYRATRGGGATANGDPLAADSDVPLEHGTVSYVVGLPAVRDEELRPDARAVSDALDSVCKRVLETWSPCVDWGLLARGATEGVVCFHPDIYEQYPGTLLAEESGAATRSTDTLYVAAPDAETRDRLFETATSIL